MTTPPLIGCQSIARLSPSILLGFPAFLLVPIYTPWWRDRHLESRVFCRGTECNDLAGVAPEPLHPESRELTVRPLHLPHPYKIARIALFCYY